MKCFKCGIELEDDSKFCYACGANLQEAEVLDDEAVEVAETEVISKTKTVDEGESVSDELKKIDTFKEIVADKDKLGMVIKLIVGTILIVIGFQRIFTSGTSISSTSFGADFYTYTYQGIVAISEMLGAIEATLGWIIVAIGSAINISALKK